MIEFSSHSGSLVYLATPKRCLTCLSCLKAPALYIAADEPQPRADMTRFHEICPNLMFGQTVGSGHFCQLEVPEQINPMIERFLTVVL